MKQWKKIILFSVILALLLGAWGFSNYLKEKKAADALANITPTPTVEPILSLDETTVEKITVINSSYTLVFTPKDETTESGEQKIQWNIISPKNSNYSLTTINAKVTYYLLLNNFSKITNSSATLSDFGLDDPVAKVQILLKSGEKITVLYGDVAPKSGSQYVMLEGEDQVYTTSTANSGAALLAPIDFLDLSVLGGFTVDEVKKFNFKRAKDNLDMNAVSKNDASADQDLNATWQIISPVSLDARYDGFYAVLEDLLSISSQKYIELSPKDLSIYGLDNPSYEFTITGDDREVRCILGKSAGDGQLYGYSDYTDAVFIVTMQVLENIDKPFLEIADTYVNIMNIWDVSEINIDIDGTPIFCTVKEDKEKVVESDFRVNGQDANVVDSSDDSYFRTFYQSVVSIFIENIDVNATPLYDPDIIMDCRMNVSSNNVMIGFVKRDAKSYYVFKDGVYQGYYVNRSNFYSETEGYEGILPAYQILKNAMDNQVNGVYH
jgi:hypothetical protein